MAGFRGVVAAHEDQSGVTHRQIQTAIRWQAWALCGLAVVGAWALLEVRSQLQTFDARIIRFEVTIDKSIDNLTGALSTSNNVLQTVAIKLEGIDTRLDEARDEIRTHEAMPVERAHDRVEERRR